MAITRSYCLLTGVFVSKGIYFEGKNGNGLCLGIVLLIDDSNKIARIVLGLPTAG
ncbi:hypothetical protein [Clostridium sediminicola]|uniref:hypothetical protein n=1 Tax=Clostridium sediminicola TaxID=3114879 RepID=UPI003D169B7B